MKNKYFPEATVRLKVDYDINVIDDVILGERKRVILYAEIANDENITFNVIAGSLTNIGFDDSASITLSDLLTSFNYNNKYAEMGGPIEHFRDVKSQISKFQNNTDVTFPIIRNGKEIWLRYTSSPIVRNPKLISVAIDNVTENYTYVLEEFEKIHKDSLTHLFNKYTLDYHYGLRYHKEGLHVFFIDIDNFKQVNDTDGHDVGNLCLKKFADILLSLQKDYDLFYRVGGDEFVGLFFGNKTYIKKVAEEILRRARSIQTPKSKKLITVSIGIIKGTINEDLIVKADKILYEAKRNGKDQYIYKIESE